MNIILYRENISGAFILLAQKGAGGNAKSCQSTSNIDQRAVVRLLRLQAELCVQYSTCLKYPEKTSSKITKWNIKYNKLTPYHV